MWWKITINYTRWWCRQSLPMVCGLNICPSLPTSFSSVLKVQVSLDPCPNESQKQTCLYTCWSISFLLHLQNHILQLPLQKFQQQSVSVQPVSADCLAWWAAVLIRSRSFCLGPLALVLWDGSGRCWSSGLPSLKQSWRSAWPSAICRLKLAWPVPFCHTMVTSFKLLRRKTS